jgi:hypothetical protein
MVVIRVSKNHAILGYSHTFMVYTVTKILIFPARESLVSEIPAGDGKIANLF